MEQHTEHTHTVVHENVPEEQKDALTKTFAIVGFSALLIFIVWLAVQLVGFMPSAFSSLASLADSVYNYNPDEELVVATDNSVVNAGESFTISWTQLQGAGSYSFQFACTEGVAVDVKNLDGQVVSLACDTPLPLAQSTSLQVLVASGKYRFVDIPYTLTYAKEGTEAGMKKTTKTITVVNATISANAPTENEEPEVKPDPVTPTKPVVKPTVKPTVPVTTTVPKVIFSIPVSNPNGTIDLQVTYLGVGTLSGNTFVKTSTLDNDAHNAMQFEVKNIGTKTTDSWDYVAELPASITYRSPNQKALRPNERAVITLGFDGLTNTGTDHISVEVTTHSDIKSSNNEFDATVKIVN